MAHPDQLLEGLSKYLTEQAAPLLEEASKKAGESDLSSAYNQSEQGRSLLGFAMDIRLFRSRIEENFRKFGLAIPTIEQLVPELAQPAVAETPTEVAAEPEELPAAPPAEEEPRAPGDLTAREEQIAKLYFAPNENGKDFAHTTETITLLVYGTSIDEATTPNERSKRRKASTAAVRRSYLSIEDKLLATRKNPDETPKHLAKFVTDTEAQFPGINRDDMVDVLRGKAEFTGLQRRLTRRAAIGGQSNEPAWPLRHGEPRQPSAAAETPTEPPVAPAEDKGPVDKEPAADDEALAEAAAEVGPMAPAIEVAEEDEESHAAPSKAVPGIDEEAKAAAARLRKQESRTKYSLNIDGRDLEVMGKLALQDLEALSTTSLDHKILLSEFEEKVGKGSRDRIRMSNKRQFARLGFKAVIEGSGGEATIYLERLTQAVGEVAAEPAVPELGAGEEEAQTPADKRLMPDGQEVKVSAHQFKAVEFILNASAEDILLSDDLMDLVYPDPNIPLKDKRNRLSVVLTAIRDGLPENWKLVSARKKGSRSSGYYFERSEPTTAEAETAPLVPSAPAISAEVETPTEPAVPEPELPARPARESAATTVIPERPSMRGYDNDESAVVFCLWDSYGDTGKALTRSELEEKVWGTVRPDIKYFPLPMYLQHKLQGDGHEVGIIEPQGDEKEAKYYMKSYTEPEATATVNTTVEEPEPAGLAGGSIDLSRDEEEEEKPVDLLLTDKDTFLLAKRICEIDPQRAQAAGLRLTDKDTEEAGKTTEALAELTDSITEADKVLLRRKLLALANDRDGAIDANLTNDKAFVILAIVSGINNPDQVEAFLGSN